jgi:hypothetical protein
MKATVSRRHMLAAAAVTITPTAAPAANSSARRGFAFQPYGTAELPSATDPVFAAIERCRAAMRARERSLTNFGEALNEQRLRAANDAILAWLTTAPTTMDGAIATLEYAAMRDDEQTFLLESAYYDRERLAAAEQFPAMIAAALRKIAGS